jgi:adenylate kinase
MSEFHVIGVFGISGVGKGTLIAEARKIAPDSLHLQASALIKRGLDDPEIDSDALRRRRGGQIRLNQDILVESFWLMVRAQPHRLVVFDGHLVIDTDRELVEIPLEIIASLRPSLMVHVEDAEKIAARRFQDRDRVRPMRSEEVLQKHQRLSRKLCEAYASALKTEKLVCGPDDVERFRSLLKISDQSVLTCHGRRP